MYYLICTEYKNPEGVRTILTQYFPNGYTIFAPGQGVWKGVPEPSMTIGIAGAEPQQIQYVAEDIKRLNEQDSVMVLTFPADVQFI